MTSTGTVAMWSADEGWGVIMSPDTPGGCWAHFASLDMPGYRTLDTGDIVDFEWEQPGQEGYAYRASNVRPRRAHSGEQGTGSQSSGRSPAYGSSLTITPGEAN